MIPVDLITGFLGAGKTTFLLRYAKYLMGQGLRLGVLVYDHGALNVDMPLLQELRQSGRCELEMLVGTTDPDFRKRRFRTKLIAMGMSGYDRVLIEPSGVFDMDEFFDTLREPPLDRWYEVGSVIAVVDAKLGDEGDEEADFFLASQAASAGCILLSRTQLAAPEELAATLRHLDRAEAHIHCTAPLMDRVLSKDWGALTDGDFARLAACGCHMEDYVKTIAGGETGFQSLFFFDLGLDRAQLTEKTAPLFQSDAYGRILRVKGFFQEAGRWYQINATKRDFLIEEVPENRDALLVIGRGLREEAISLLLTGKPPERRFLKT